ncbi:hypothetical protein [Symbiopectobacterium sp. RP]|uniref:hypothetical protein n=1 Tax=Symbiopectobacterium sp. RP TaxID=3248553 RepID=UPI003D2DAB24
MSINGHKQKKREWLRYRDFVLSPYGVIKIKSLCYMFFIVRVLVNKPEFFRQVSECRYSQPT